MIKSDKDFKIIVSDLSKEPKNTIGKIDYKMDSTEFNKIMNTINTELDILYSNIRYIDDLADYCKTYIEKTIKEKQIIINEKLKTIEQLKDSYIDKDYIVNIINFKNNDTIVRDNYGDIIPVMSYSNNKLESSYSILSNAVIKSVTNINSKEYGCYKNTYQNLLENKSYRSIYYTNEPKLNGIIESYNIEFKNPTEINYINLNIVNCDIAALYIIDENENRIEIDLTYPYFNSVLAIGIEFTLVCKNYNNSYNYANESKIDTLLSNSINGKLKISNSSINNEKDKSDLDKLSSIGLYRGKYAKWNNEKNLTTNNMALSSNISGTIKTVASTNRTLNNDVIVCTNGSIIEQTSATGYVYIPNTEVETTPIEYDSLYEYEAKPDPQTASTMNYVIENGYEYNFGIDSIEIQKRQINKESGYITEEIELGLCDYIKIFADINSKESSNTEFYIIEDKEVTLIVPTNDAINGDTYYPKTKKIKLKILTNIETYPIILNSLAILKYGGDVQWINK